MNPALEGLKDLHLPPVILMWPIAPAWIFLYSLILVITWGGFYWWQRKSKQQYTVRFALKQLKKLEQIASEDPQQLNVAAEVSTLLRRTALFYFQREEVASLSGDAWLSFLKRHTTKSDYFTAEGERLLISAPYQKEVDIDLSPLFSLAKSWLIALAKK